MKKDITTRKDIELLVDNFYIKIKADPLLSHFFSDIVKVHWNNYLPVMYSFWENALFFTGSYLGNPLEVHKHLNKLKSLHEVHFLQWNKLFIETVDELFEGEKAILAKERAINISTVMQLSIFGKT